MGDRRLGVNSILTWSESCWSAFDFARLVTSWKLVSSTLRDGEQSTDATE